jgi:hypothetical protein
MVWYFLLLKKAPKSQLGPIYFALLVWFTNHPVEGIIKNIKTGELESDNENLRQAEMFKIGIHQKL